MSGIAGVFSVDRKFTGKDLVEWLFSTAVYLRPRGEAGAGVSMIDQWGEIKVEKKLGPVEQSLSLDQLKKISNPSVFSANIHDRYAREEHPNIVNTQPIELEPTSHYEATIVADSKLAGWDEMNSWFIHEKPRKTQTGAEVLGRIFLRELENTEGNMQEAGKRFFYNMNGKGFFSAIMLLKEKSKGKTYLIALRDPSAGQPFHYGKKDGTFFFSSGTYAIEQAGIRTEDIKDVLRGSMLVISDNGLDIIEYEELKKTNRKAECVFEKIYFGCPYDKPLTELGPEFYRLFDKYFKQLEINPTYRNKSSNYDIRAILGTCLAERHPELIDKVDILAPIPDTGKGVTYGVSKATGIPISEALIKILLARSFQISDAEFRKLIVDLKNAGLAEFVDGKLVAIGDDSVVKGGVGGYYSKKKGVLGLLESMGAKELIMLISYASMPFQCINKQDIPYHRREKMAAEGLYHLPQTVQEKIVGSMLGSGINIPLTLMYQKNNDIYSIFGPDHCFACMDGKYPIAEKYIADGIKAQIDMSYALANKKWV